ncbi:MAG: glycerophosphodiester phosphodiesterase, partial [Deltaproteobacteria bacterium]
MASRPLVIAHRGASGTLPENTKLAFAKAIDLGADAIEFDVQLTADNVAVVIHDETLDRTTSGSGRVSETTFDKIRALDAGSWFAASFAGLEVPTLEEVLDAVGSRVLLNIEL